MIRSFKNKDTQEISGVGSCKASMDRSSRGHPDSAVEFSRGNERGSQGTVQHSDQQTVAAVLQVEGWRRVRCGNRRLSLRRVAYGKELRIWTW
jgi:hypothetical protein